MVAPAGAATLQNGQTSDTQNQAADSAPGGAPASSAKQKKKSTADENAFPMEQSSAAAKSAPPPATTPQTGGADNRSGTDTAKHNKQSPAQDNPFPEEQSTAAAKPNGGQRQPSVSGDSQGSAPQSGSSSSGEYSSSDENLPPPDVGEGTGKQNNKKMDSFTRDQTQDGRVQNDLNVADYYMKNGNYRGAFSRYDDALQYDPQNDTALFGRAFALCKQNLTGEAMAQFKTYTKTNPQGKYALKAEKLMVHPNKCMHNF